MRHSPYARDDRRSGRVMFGLGLFSLCALVLLAIAASGGCATLRGDRPPTTQPGDETRLTEQQEIEIQAARAAAWTFLPPPWDAIGAAAITLAGIKLATRKRKPTAS
jgi:hypothetical protein